jgi:protein-disulfide isomerase/uncharacterized membrane protein
MEPTNVASVAPMPRPPKPLIRWLAVILAAAGWYVSLQLLRVSASGQTKSLLLQAVCGGASKEGELDDCASVLTSEKAYFDISSDPGVPKIPVSAFGMAYFAIVGLWYLFVGPPTRAGRNWHWLIAVLVLLGAQQSLAYIGVMKYELHRWCGGCLAAHALNGGLLLLTALAYPWRQTADSVTRYPTARLVLAIATAGLFVFIAHLAVTYVAITGSMLRERGKEYEAVLSDPEYLVWDHNRQPTVSIPLRDDEVFAGSPDAAITIVEFGDFQCEHCLKAHEVFVKLAGKYSERFRLAFRYYPQDSECNPNPRYRGAGHASGCRAARAAEAARIVGGREAYLAMRKTLWERQKQLPKVPFAEQSEPQRKLFEDWAVEIGLDRAAFAAAMDSPAVAERIQADIKLADGLGIQAMPVVYVNGKRLRNWSNLAAWDIILGGKTPAATQPTTAGVQSEP